VAAAAVLLERKNPKESLKINQGDVVYVDSLPHVPCLVHAIYLSPVAPSDRK